MPLAIVDLPIPPMPLMVTVTSLVNVMLVINIAVLICFNNFGREIKFIGSVGGWRSVQTKHGYVRIYVATATLATIKYQTT